MLPLLRGALLCCSILSFGSLAVALPDDEILTQLPHPSLLELNADASVVADPIVPEPELETLLLDEPSQPDILLQPVSLPSATVDLSAEAAEPTPSAAVEPQNADQHAARQPSVRSR